MVCPAICVYRRVDESPDGSLCMFTLLVEKIFCDNMTNFKINFGMLKNRVGSGLLSTYYSSELTKLLVVYIGHFASYPSIFLIVNTLKNAKI